MRQMESTETAVVYVCSPDRERHLFHSLATALRWGHGVDRFIVYCVGERPRHWAFADPRVEVHEVSRLFGDYFHGNKAYLCEVPAARVLFLDADTIVLRPLELLWSGWCHDFRARIANATYGPRWKHDVWLETFRHLGARPLPMFNAGVLLFQNGAHRKIAEEWRSLIAKYQDGLIAEPLEINRHQSEQWALALATSLASLSISMMGPNEHTYGWLDEPLGDTIVLHTSAGGDRFEQYLTQQGIALPRDFLLRNE